MTSTRALRGPFDYRLPEELRGGVHVGSMLVVPFSGRKLLGVVVGLADSSEVADEKLLSPLRALDEGPPALTAELVALAEWIAAEYCSTIARALALVLPPQAARRLSGRKRRAVARPTHLPVGIRTAHAPALTPDQQAALAPVTAALRDRRAERLLLHGVTGSGKTEVYLRAAATALEQGRGAIVLVPEIALTPQIVSRFVERFGDTVAVLHSRLTPGQRYAEWRRLREGQARVCVGPRSAVFAPIEGLGLIVVDEEHDASYKHEGDPRYDARDVAAERAARCGAVLLAGSATPRPESVASLRACALPRRVDGRPLPRVDVLDMRGQAHGLHPLTAQALAEVRAARGKAIVLLNRRGWSNFLSCRSCGLVWSCPDCDVALVLHRAGGFVACHHCGHNEPVPTRCSQCASASIARHGTGTERLQHELAHVFDDGRFPVFRLDADAVGPGAGSAAAVRAQGASAAAEGDGEDGGAGELLRRFEAAECGVLIGTQMVAKGHDFADVSLGVVLDADATLRFPDFRAEERTFALIAQLAGRAGRGGRRARAGADDRPRSPLDRARRAPRQSRFHRRRAGAQARAALPAVLASDQDRVLGRERGEGACCRGRRACVACTASRVRRLARERRHSEESQRPCERVGRHASGRAACCARPRHAVSPARARALGIGGEGRAPGAGGAGRG